MTTTYGTKVSMETYKNFENFDRMLRRSHKDSDHKTYAAVLVVDKVKRKNILAKSHDVDAWYDMVASNYWKGGIQKFVYYSDGDDVSDIED